MQNLLKEKQIWWIDTLMSTHRDWLKRRWHVEVIERIIYIRECEEYDEFDRVILNEIREEWLTHFGQ